LNFEVILGGVRAALLLREFDTRLLAVRGLHASADIWRDEFF
jgi:hypothetical protein